MHMYDFIYYAFFIPYSSFAGEILSKQKLVCTLCLSQFPYTSSKNTSNIKRHLLLKHRAEYIELVQTKPNIKRNRHVGEEVRGQWKNKES